MKSYPSIPKKVVDEPVYLFDKLDGSNLRAEWTPKNGFAKFGTRNRLMSPEEPFGKAIPIFMDTYAEQLEEIFRKQRYQKATAYFEFFGPSSFAGNHDWGEQHEVVLFDVDVYKKGLTPPKQFLEQYGDLKIPKVLYHGKVTHDIFISVKRSQLEGMTLEGVVAKGVVQRKRKRKEQRGDVFMFKIKSDAWLNQLRTFCEGNEALYRRLA